MANYRVLDDNNTEIFDLFIPKQCVAGSTHDGHVLAGVNSGAFKDCSRLTSVEFEDACQIGTIGDYVELGGAFENCSAITEIILNADDSHEVKNFVIDGAFKNCSSLASVDTTNLHLSDVNSGIQLGQDAFYGTAFTNFNVPYVNTLGSFSLAHCSALERVTTDAYFLGSRVFDSDSNLTTITFRNADLYQVGSEIFKGCSSLTTIIFYGTIAQWNAIQKQNGWEEELAYIPNEWTTNEYLVNCYDGDTPLVPMVQRQSGLYNNGVYTSWANLVSQGKVTVSGNTLQSVDTALVGDLVVDDAIRIVNNNAFKDCTSIKNVVLPTNTTQIKDNAFSGCTSLISVEFKGTAVLSDLGANAFYNCINLTSFRIPSGITEIKANTFYNCRSLTGVEIPSTVTIIRSDAFSGCAAMTSITIPSNVQNIESGAFGNSGLTSVTIPNTVLFIGTALFSGCTDLTSVTLPSGLTSIPNSTFEGCTSLTSYTIPSGITTIGNYVFAGSGLTSITIPNTVTSVGEQAFLNCASLATATLSNTLTTLKRELFAGCSSLTSITIPASVTTIENGVFANSGLTGITIPNTVTSIGGRCFYHCYDLITANLSDNITTIPQELFSGCNALLSISIPSGVTLIELEAFKDCNSITTITIPSSVNSLGNNILEYCTSLTTVNMSNMTGTIGDFIFKDCSNLTTINFNATMNDWYNLDKSDGWLDDLLYMPGGWTTGTYQVHCTDGDCNIVQSLQPRAGLYYNGNYTPWASLISNNKITVDANNVITAVDKPSMQGKLVFADTITDISTGVFQNCSDLTEIVFLTPINLTGRYVFSGTGITEIDTADILNLPNQTFKNCASLTKAVLSANSNITNAFGLFENCTSLVDLTIEEGLETIPSTAYDMFTGCTALVDVVFPDSLQSIFARTFANCSSIENVTLGLKFADRVSSDINTFWGQTVSGTEIFNNSNNIKHIYFNGNIGDWFLNVNNTYYRRLKIYVKQINNGQYYMLPIEAKDGDIYQHYLDGNTITKKTSSKALTRALLTSDLGYTITDNKLYKNGVEVTDVHITGGYNYDTSHYYYLSYTSGSVFNGLTNIETLELPACLSSLGSSNQKGTVSDCPNLKKFNTQELINVSSYNYTVNNGFEELNLERYNYIQGTYSSLLITTSDFTNSLGNLKYLRLGNEVIPYGANAISGLNSLETLVLGKIHAASQTNTTNFGNTLTANSLRVEYEGTIADYNNTTYIPANFKTALANLQTAAGNTIHCTDGDCDFSGNAI